MPNDPRINLSPKIWKTEPTNFGPNQTKIRVLAQCVAIALVKMAFPAVNAMIAKPMLWVTTVICANQTTTTIQIAKVCFVRPTFRDNQFFSECKCNPDGSLQCDTDGNCACKEGYDGIKCDECKQNYIGFPNCKGFVTQK